MTVSGFSDSALLNDAELILRDAGFQTKRDSIAGADAPWLLAEDEFFVVAVVATGTLADAHRVEAFAASELLIRIAESELGAKRWDAYLVVLSEEVTDDPNETRRLVELQYDTRGVRRLVATGVTERSRVVETLRPFLPLPQPTAGGLSDAMTDLVDQLTLNGVERTKAELYVAAFSETGDLDGV